MNNNDLTQWVNLPKKDVFVEDDIESVERLGTIQYKATFKTDDAASFKVHLIAEGGDNKTYSKEEIKRSRRYKNVPIAVAGNISDSSDEVIYDEYIELPAMGGNKYRIEATYKGKPVSSTGIITVARKAFFEVLTMDGVNPPGKADIENNLASAFDVSNIRIVCKEVGTRKNDITRIKTVIDSAHEEQIDNEMSLKRTSGSHDPYVIPVAFVDMIAGFKKDTVKHDLASGFNAKYLLLKDGILSISTKSPEGSKYLFYSFDDDMDAGKLWLEGDGAVEDESGQRIAKLTRDAIISQGLTHIRFKVDKGLSDFLEKKKGRIVLPIRVVDGITNGYAGGGRIVVALKELADYKGARKYKGVGQYMETIKHEFGHIFKQASTGDRPAPANPGPRGYVFIKKDSPDSHADLYGEYHRDCGAQTNNYGHTGAHCKHGATYDPDAPNGSNWSVLPGKNLCVMFGASGLGDRADFCDNCKLTLRKVDLK